MHLKKLPTAATTVAMMIASLLGSAAQGAEASTFTAVTPTLAADQELEAVTVSARRREEELQDVPLPITVIDAALIEDTGSFNVQRLTQLAPTLQFYSSNPRNSAANIRGLGAPFGLTNDGIEQGVGLYVDDVYYSRAAASTLDFLDVERIEVLRGPQGTLYGKNTTAGAINITTRTPTFDPEGTAEISVGNLGYYQAKAAVSGPLVGDSVAGRIAVSTTSRHGTIFNTASRNLINELDNVGVRGQILWRASDILDVTFSGDYAKQNAECCGSVFVRVGNTQRAANRQYYALANLQDTNPQVAGIQPYRPPSTDPFDRLTDYDAELAARNELGGAAVRAVWDLGGQGSFTSVTAWRYWDWLPRNDRDFTGLAVTTKSNNPTHQDQYTQEFRYNYSGEKFDYVIGLFGYRQTVHTDGIQEQGPAASRWLISPTGATAALSLDPSVLNGLTSTNDIDFKNTSAALFSQLSWHVTDSFHVEPGVRLNYDDKKGSYISSVVNGVGELLPISPADVFYTNAATGARHRAQRDAITPQAYVADFSDWNVSGDLKLSYELTPDVLAYVSYARTFKTGGITLNGVPTDTATGLPLLGTERVRPEKVSNYEIGLKTQFLDRKATLNFALFQTDVKDFQATVNNGQVSVIRGYLANAEKVRIQGAETDFSYRPTNNWSFYVNGAYTDAVYEKFTGAPCPPELSGGSTTTTNPALVSAPGTPGGVSPAFCDVSGQWLPGVSKWSGAWGVQYDHPAHFLGREGEAYLGYDGSARSRWSSNPSRSIYSDVGGYALANFRLGFRSQGSWDVYAWVRNAFDKDYFELLNAATGGNTGLVVGQPADPRTYGVTLRAQF
ncbi:MAG: TonB-dependent receptor [Steroidobacteraceae bacterium]